MSATITIQFIVPIGYSRGDYGLLYGNGGSGDIDYDTPLTSHRYELFPDGAGIYRVYETPCYQTPCYQPWATRAGGCYHQPCYQTPCYYGTAVINIEYEVAECGDYKFALKLFDELDNDNTGSIEELSQTIHIAPEDPVLGLEKNSYNKTTDVLVLDVAA